MNAGELPLLLLLLLQLKEGVVDAEVAEEEAALIVAAVADGVVTALDIVCVLVEGVVIALDDRE